MPEYKPKPIKNLKIIHKGIVYDKIEYLSCSWEGVHFTNLDGENMSTNVNCKMEDIEIIVNQDTK